MTDQSEKARAFFGRAFNYANNPLSIAGIVVTTVSALSIITFMLMEAAGGLRNPYFGIVAYLILPGIFLVALLVIPIGMWRRRRKLQRAGVPDMEQMRYPRLDFNNPQLRRMATIVLILTMINAVIFGLSSALAIEHMESVEFCGTTCHSLMEPEYTAYQQSPHSRVACVQCHIGPGASWFVRSKVDGLRQVWKTLDNTYERPIATPIQKLRPARETCEQCHWPAKHYGDKVKVFARYASDESNTPGYTAMLFKTGGGRLDLGTHGGIHWWHIYSDNKIRYYGDESHENVSWVELTTKDGEVRTYSRQGEELPPTAELEAQARVMDCIDCHNRPTHLMESPDKALDEALSARAPLAALPYFKREALRAVVGGEYPTHAEGMTAVSEAITKFYQESYPDIWRDQQPVVEEAAQTAARVYGRSVFPEMKTDWKTHPNHIGHEDSPGCFRCHDEEMSTSDGQHVITMDCETCHAFLVQDDPTPPDLAALVNGG